MDSAALTIIALFAVAVACLATGIAMLVGAAWSLISVGVLSLVASALLRRGMKRGG